MYKERPILREVEAGVKADSLSFSSSSCRFVHADLWIHIERREQARSIRFASSPCLVLVTVASP
jgi:hypothetical protein